jgi:hypothetical protein
MHVSQSRADDRADRFGKRAAGNAPQICRDLSCCPRSSLFEEQGAPSD